MTVSNSRHTIEKREGGKLFLTSKKQKNRYLWPIAIVAFGAGAWLAVSYTIESAKLPSPSTIISLTSEKVYPRTETLTGSYLAWRSAKRDHATQDAADFMDISLRKDPNNTELMYEALRIYVVANQMDKARDIANKMKKQQSQDPLMVMILLADAIKRNDIEASAEMLALQTQPGFLSLIKPLFNGWASLPALPKDQPIHMDKEVTKAGFLSPFFRYQLALMNDVLGHNKEAERYYEEMIEQPEAAPFRVIQAKANYYMRQGNQTLAQTAYDLYDEHHPDSYLTPKTLPDADKMPADIAPLVADARDGMAEIFFTMASLFYGESMSQDALLYLRIALDLRPDLPPAQIMMASIFEQQKDYDAAIAIYQSMSSDSAFYHRGQIRMALNYEAKDDLKKAIRILKQLSEQDSDDIEAVTSLGDVYRADKDFKRAAAAYSTAIERAKKRDGEAKWALYYARGICYERMDQWELAEKDFLHALDLETNQPDVLNYLGYSWLVQNKHITQAKQYIKLAVEERPHDAHIIDSMGWAHFMVGEWDKAVEYLEQAIDLTPQDPTINDHLGDAYWRVGRRIEAVYQWQRALGLEPEEDDIPKIQEKIENGLPSVDDSMLARETPTRDALAVAEEENEAVVE